MTIAETHQVTRAKHWKGYVWSGFSAHGYPYIEGDEAVRYRAAFLGANSPRTLTVAGFCTKCRNIFWEVYPSTQKERSQHYECNYVRPAGR